MKEVALLTGFGADEFAIWDLKLPYLLGDEIAAILGVPANEFVIGEWQVNADQFEALLDLLRRTLLDRSGTVMMEIGMCSVHK